MSDKEKSHLRLEKIGFVYQFYNLLPAYTIEENILIPVILSGEKSHEYNEWLNILLEYICLEKNVLTIHQSYLVDNSRGWQLQEL